MLRDSKAHALARPGLTELRETSDSVVLAELGVQQVFKRELNTFTNCAVAFSIISVPATIPSVLQLAWNYGGPASALYGWLIVSGASLLVGLSMAEIVSALPSCGGPYFWTSVLAGKHGPLMGWITGWFNLLGQIAIVAAAAAAPVTLIFSLLSLADSFVLTQAQQLGLFAAFLVAAGIVNSMPARFMACFSAFSVFWNFTCVLSLVLALPTVAPWRQSARFVWLTFYDYTESSSGITNNVYLFLQGFLMAQYCIIGYDSCAHMSEETQGAFLSAPYAILLAIGSSAVLGYILLVVLVICVQDPSNVLTGKAAGLAAAQIVYDAFEARFGKGIGGLVLMSLSGTTMFLCLVFCMLAGSRMLYSFARNRGIPAHLFFSRVSRLTHTPLRTIWLLTACAFLLGLPLLKSAVAFAAVVSITSIGLLVSYAIPMVCKLTLSRRRFVPGPFSLGRYSELVGWLAVGWMVLASVCFCLPAVYPISVTTFNYSPVAVSTVLLGSLISWYFPKWGARHWFTGQELPVQMAQLWKVHHPALLST